MRTAWFSALFVTTQLKLHFSALATLDCGNTSLTSASGNITSPGYPAFYSHNANCTWVIQAPSDKVIEITFQLMVIEDHRLCNFDYLMVYNGDELYTGRKLCGKVPPRNFVSSSSFVRVVFRSDDLNNARGFRLTWNIIDRCSDDEYTCWNGQCIPSLHQCDGVENCADGEDEIECPHEAAQSDQCGKSNVPIEFTWDPRIVGGSAAVEGSFPWVAMLAVSSDESLLCGASIISRRTVLTAAHCFLQKDPDPSSFVVFVGRYKVGGNAGEQKIPVFKVLVHHNYTGSSDGGYDIAVVHLTSFITYTTTVRPICLPMPGQFRLEVGKMCVAVGWGVLEYDGTPADRLYQARLPIASRELCARNYATKGVTLLDTQLCAGDTAKGGVDACQGDSGGPLLCLFGSSWYQVGVTSFGIQCADPRYPGIFTDVSMFYNWTQENSGDNETSTATVPSMSTSTTSGTWQHCKSAICLLTRIIIAFAGGTFLNFFLT